MIVDSPLPPAAYKTAIRNKLENFRNFRDERFSGVLIRPIFRITHNSYTEWNRRISGEMNHAIGFLKKTETGCRIYFIHTTGFLSPFHLFVTYLLILFLSVFYDFAASGEWTRFILSGVITVLCAISTAITHALTDNGIRGGDTLYALMEDPNFGQGE